METHAHQAKPLCQPCHRAQRAPDSVSSTQSAFKRTGSAARPARRPTDLNRFCLADAEFIRRRHPSNHYLDAYGYGNRTYDLPPPPQDPKEPKKTMDEVVAKSKVPDCRADVEERP